MIDVVIVTEKACLKENLELKYASIALEEDSALQEVFSQNGISHKRVAWEDQNFDWASAQIALIRSTWNYSDHLPEFIAWLEKVSQKTQLINSKDLMLWNMDKRYLLALEKQGIAIPKTYVLKTQDAFDPYFWKDTFKNKGAVVKPLTSAGAKDTYHLKFPFNESEVLAVRSILKSRPMMVQPFISSIQERGEISLVFINGKFTHAKVKKPRPDDFRVQPYHGGTIKEYHPTQNEINFGLDVLSVCKNLIELPLFARVDFCYGISNTILLMELELIEPQLWCPDSELAVSSLMAGIQNILHEK